MVRELIVTMLGRHGFQVLVARSSSSAAAVINRLEGRVDLLLTDVILPDGNGAALYHQLAGLCPDMRVLYMSGYTENVIVHHGILPRGANFIEKPFPAADLIARIEAVLHPHPDDA
jgi:DNA-binding response OmpR family regulator